jgi:cytochrome b6-f complex iron-sulfur subunit
MAKGKKRQRNREASAGRESPRPAGPEAEHASEPGRATAGGGSVTGPRGVGAPRRRFLWTAWLGLLGIMVAEGVWVLVDFLRPRRARARTDEPGVVVAGAVEQFEPGSVTAFPQGRFYLVRLEDGGFLAVSRECTHLGCTVPWVADDNRFVCPCHSSAFDIRGDVVNPPALDLYEVRIENRVVKVNTANLRKRRAFEAAQVTRA